MRIARLHPGIAHDCLSIVNPNLHFVRNGSDMLSLDPSLGRFSVGLELRMENAELRMGNGECRIENGEWRMEN